MNSFHPLDVESLRARGRHTYLVADLPVDTETPVSLYAKLCGDQPYAFLFESAVPDSARGRYSILGYDPYAVHEFEAERVENPLDFLRVEMERMGVVFDGPGPKFPGGFVGYFTYEVVRHFEKIPVPERGPVQPLPEGVFYVPRIFFIFDHLTQRLSFHRLISLEGDVVLAVNEAEHALEAILARLQAPQGVRLLELSERSSRVDFGEAERSYFLSAVGKAKEAILDGEVFQLVLSQAATFSTSRSPFDLYRRLRQHNPSPYMYFMRFDEFSIVGASPETLVQLQDGVVTVRPIAGTRPRGKDGVEEAALEAELRQDEKELAEHRMLVDLARHDVGRVAEPGTVEVTQLMTVQRFASVMHLVSEVQGRQREDLDAFDVFQACFPAGTLTGAPKVRAMELIARLEARQRGLYGGAVGYFGFNGNMDFAIAIRTILVRDGRFSIQAGAGLVYDSVPEREHDECVNKAQSSLLALI